MEEWFHHIIHHHKDNDDKLWIRVKQRKGHPNIDRRTVDVSKNNVNIIHLLHRQLDEVLCLKKDERLTCIMYNIDKSNKWDSSKKLRTKSVDSIGTFFRLMSISTGIVPDPQFEVFLVLQQRQINAQQFECLRKKTSPSSATESFFRSNAYLRNAGCFQMTG